MRVHHKEESGLQELEEKRTLQAEATAARDELDDALLTSSIAC